METDGEVGSEVPLGTEKSECSENKTSQFG